MEGGNGEARACVQDRNKNVTIVKSNISFYPVLLVVFINTGVKHKYIF